MSSLCLVLALSLLFVGSAFAQATAAPDECNPIYNVLPHGTNEACIDPRKPYCVEGMNNSFCSECNPDYPNDYVCSCPAGMACNANRTSPTYGTCTTWPKQLASCQATADCTTQYFVGNVLYVTVSGRCIGGVCYQCNAYLNEPAFNCSFGAFSGHDRLCARPGQWTSSYRSNETVPSQEHPSSGKRSGHEGGSVRKDFNIMYKDFIVEDESLEGDDDDERPIPSPGPDRTAPETKSTLQLKQLYKEYSVAAAKKKKNGGAVKN